MLSEYAGIIVPAARQALRREHGGGGTCPGCFLVGLAVIVHRILALLALTPRISDGDMPSSRRAAGSVDADQQCG